MLGVSIAIHRPSAARDRMNISLHVPELYYFLSLLTGIAALLAVISRRKRNRAKPLDVVGCQVKPLPRAVPAPSSRATDAIARDGQSVPAAEEEIDETRQAGEQAAERERFSRLCESVKDLSPKEQVSRVHEHFGIFGGAPPPKGRSPGRERR